MEFVSCTATAKNCKRQSPLQDAGRSQGGLHNEPTRQPPSRRRREVSALLILTHSYVVMHAVAIVSACERPSEAAHRRSRGHRQAARAPLLRAYVDLKEQC